MGYNADKICIHMNPVVRMPISANSRLHFNLVPLFKSLFGIIFYIAFRASNYHIPEKKNSDLKSDFTHTNPGLS